MSVIDHRRALHRIPELDNQLPETSAYVRSVLEPLGCAISSPIPEIGRASCRERV